MSAITKSYPTTADMESMRRVGNNETVINLPQSVFESSPMDERIDFICRTHTNRSDTITKPSNRSDASHTPLS